MEDTELDENVEEVLESEPPPRPEPTPGGNRELVNGVVINLDQPFTDTEKAQGRANLDVYSKREVDQEISTSISGDVGEWLGNMSVDEANELTADRLRSGDHVSITDSGTITLGNVEVVRGDDIFWHKSAQVWELKVVSDKGFVVIGEELSFG